MMVEFIGCTGAGKTTLIREVQALLAGHARVLNAGDLGAALLGLPRFRHPTLINLSQDLLGLPAFLGTLPRQRAFVGFVAGTLFQAARREPRQVPILANYWRSIVRKLGVYEMARRFPSEQVVLIDEGTVLAAHLLFVFHGPPPRPADLDRFAQLVPLPDLLVYVTAPPALLVRRSLGRRDVRREMRSRDRAQVHASVCRASQVFDRITQAERLRSRTLTVFNGSADRKELAATAHQIAATILQLQTGPRIPPSIPRGTARPVSVRGD
ncbi:MAG: hypothetical protein KatS3mg050_4076 [Litorilinea sp.]|nr:MAG: hypothetical protein KatS3mg050_4076 [Litorilinea sp.]